MSCERFFVVFAMVLICYSCASDPEELLLGTWQVDSVYSYYNGFDIWEYEKGMDWADYEYTPDGKMKEIKFGTFRAYRYRLSGDSLFWISESEPKAGWFEIIDLRPDYLVLKRVKAPLFEGKSQERYEIRFFSRIDAEGKVNTLSKDQNN